MPSVDHESMVLFFRESPRLVVALLREVLRVEVPSDAAVSLLDSAWSRDSPDIALAALAGSAALDRDRALLYNDLILRTLGDAARTALEQLMATGKYEYRSDFARHHFGLGKSEGKAEGKAEALLKVLRLRGVPLSAEDEAHVRSVTDPGPLDAWLERSLQVAAASELWS